MDGAFLKRSQRDRFRQLAADLAVPFAIVSVTADLPTLERRIEARLTRGRDASEADRRVLQYQCDTEEPITLDEAADVVHYESNAGSDPSFVVHALFERLHTAASE